MASDLVPVDAAEHGGEGAAADDGLEVDLVEVDQHARGLEERQQVIVRDLPPGLFFTGSQKKKRGRKQIWLKRRKRGDGEKSVDLKMDESEE